MELEGAFAELGEHLFYTMNPDNQMDFLSIVKKRVENYTSCSLECKYSGSILMCYFCMWFDKDTLKETIKKLNRREIPSNLKIAF